MNQEYTIILYYKYIPIENSQALMMAQKELCAQLGLKGRIIIAREGINGTLEGNSVDIEAYCDNLISMKGFEDIVIKRSTGTGTAFPKMSIKVRNEIVSAHLNTEDVLPYEVTGTHLSADELEAWRESGKEFYIVDMRNDYEFKVGHFENSINPNMDNFRDLPQALEDLAPLKDKTVLTVCTGGVRCEKASGYLKTKGFNDVYQLQDGIVTYMEKYPNKGFKGKLYVFDNRVVMDFDTLDNHTVVGRCYLCDGSTERYVNCKNKTCNKHFLVCDSCEIEHGIFCSDTCKNVRQKVVAR